MSDHQKFVSIHAAVRLIASHNCMPASENVTLEACLGRTLAQDIFANATVPPLDASAMDGYAVRYEDVRTMGAKLRVIGEVAAGSSSGMSINQAETVRVFTGSPMPRGADHVLVQEHANVEADNITVASPQSEPRHIRKAGGDFHKGDKVLDAQTHLTARHIGLAAAANHESLLVHKRPTVAIITTGSELRAPGNDLSGGQIAESNSYTLSKVLESYGAEVRRLNTVSDDQKSIEAKFREATDAGIIITIGGASVGKHDLVRAIFAKLGGKFVFERIGVRPGKPTWFGTLSDQIVLGLPGNPTAAFVMASLLLKPLLTGISALEFADAFLTAPLPANGPRETFLRGHMTLEKGRVCVMGLKDQDTSRIKALVSANCLIHRPENDGEVSEGDLVQIVVLN